VTADVLARARDGDQDAFRELVDPCQRELQVHCYRILGSAQDAEDALQETLLAATAADAGPCSGTAGLAGFVRMAGWMCG
jgi:DNA-directed RNA polymerase specialized sigma24 family protein